MSLPWDGRLGQMIVEGDVESLMQGYPKEKIAHLLQNPLLYWKKMKRPMDILTLRLAIAPPSIDMLYYACCGSGKGTYEAARAILAVWSEPLRYAVIMGKSIYQHMLVDITAENYDLFLIVAKASEIADLAAIQYVYRALENDALERVIEKAFHRDDRVEGSFIFQHTNWTFIGTAYPAKDCPTLKIACHNESIENKNDFYTQVLRAVHFQIDRLQSNYLDGRRFSQPV